MSTFGYWGLGVGLEIVWLTMRDFRAAGLDMGKFLLMIEILHHLVYIIADVLYYPNSYDMEYEIYMRSCRISAL